MWRALAVIATCVPTAPAVAHDGPHGPDMLARVDSVVASGGRVDLHLTLTSLGGPLVLIDVRAAGATTQANVPIYLDFARDEALVAALTFTEPVPGTFSLILDFAPVGQSIVTIMSKNPER